MRYRTGDEVVLRDGRLVKVTEIEILWDRPNYKVTSEYTNFYIMDDDIDHEKTAELNTMRIYVDTNEPEDAKEGDLLYLQSNGGITIKQMRDGEWRGFYHDEGTLEHIVAEKNKVIGEKELDRRIREVNKVSRVDGTISFDDPVNHPSHYKQGEYEAIDVIKDITRDYEGFEGYLVGNIVKYLYRANYKDNKVEDIKKAQFYMNKLVEEVTGDTTTKNTD